MMIEISIPLFSIITFFAGIGLMTMIKFFVDMHK